MSCFSFPFFLTHTHTQAHTLSFVEDVQIWTSFDVTHESRDRGVTGASPDVCLGLLLSAERTRSQEPGGDHWKLLFDQLIDTHRASLQLGSKQNQGYGCSRMHMQRKVPRWASLCTRNIKVERTWRCQSYVCVMVFSQHLCWPAVCPQRRENKMKWEHTSAGEEGQCWAVSCLLDSEEKERAHLAFSSLLVPPDKEKRLGEEHKGENKKK